MEHNALAVEALPEEMTFDRTGLLRSGTELCYNSFRKKYADFLGVEFTANRSLRVFQKYFLYICKMLV